MGKLFTVLKICLFIHGLLKLFKNTYFTYKHEICAILHYFICSCLIKLFYIYIMDLEFASLCLDVSLSFMKSLMHWIYIYIIVAVNVTKYIFWKVLYKVNVSDISASVNVFSVPSIHINLKYFLKRKKQQNLVLKLQLRFSGW